MQSIAKGITGFKGRVHISLGDPLNADSFSTPDNVADELDRQILENYVLHLTNCFAYEMLEHKSPKVKVMQNQIEFCSQDWSDERAFFERHVEKVPANYREVLLRSYANPTYAKLGELPSQVEVENA